MMPTRKLPKIAYFWPGLPQLWLRGSWAGLVIAVGFTALVNVLILATCVFHEWIPSEYLLGGYGVVAVSWLVGWWQCRRQASYEVAATEKGDEQASETPSVGLGAEPREQLYRDAQRVYLQGDWVAAEQLLLKLLKLETRDAEARLMLATLWRHQGRHREALRQLDKLSRLEAADPWQNEIAVERRENAAVLKQSELLEQSEFDQNTTKTHEETQTIKMTDAQPSATEINETNRRHAA